MRLCSIQLRSPHQALDAKSLSWRPEHIPKKITQYSTKVLYSSKLSYSQLDQIRLARSSPNHLDTRSTLYILFANLLCSYPISRIIPGHGRSSFSVSGALLCDSTGYYKQGPFTSSSHNGACQGDAMMIIGTG